MWIKKKTYVDIGIRQRSLLLIGVQDDALPGQLLGMSLDERIRLCRVQLHNVLDARKLAVAVGSEKRANAGVGVTYGVAEQVVCMDGTGTPQPEEHEMHGLSCLGIGCRVEIDVRSISTMFHRSKTHSLVLCPT